MNRFSRHRLANQIASEAIAEYKANQSADGPEHADELWHGSVGPLLPNADPGSGLGPARNAEDSFCRKCGAALRPDTKFCEACGAVRGTATGLSTTDLGPPIPAPPPPSSAASHAAAHRVGRPEPGRSQALTEFRTITTTAGATAIIMLIIEIGIRSPILLVGWIATGLFVAWRCFISVPSALKRRDYTVARRALLFPAILNIISLGVIPGVLMLVAFFRSGNQELRY